MPTQADLQRFLHRIDQQGYKAYKDLESAYQFPHFVLLVDRVQGDPFAAPSLCRVRIPQAVAGFPAALYEAPSWNVALCDYLTRQGDRACQRVQQQRGSGRSGLIAMSQPGQAVLERTSVLVTAAWVEVRLVVGLPAFGRRVAGRQAAELLCEDLPEIVRSLLYANLDAVAIQRQGETVADADWLRQQLGDRGLVAFVADGAILPRQSGVDDRPLRTGQPFQSPDSLRVEFTCPYAGRITGMGIPAGITLIVGGGYHGKSTLLRAIARGVYNHVPGDGREQVVTDATAVKIRAEDQRSIVQVDISPFINQLPEGRSTTQFSTENASGSTSQAANIMEALEAGTRLLLVDEDTSATNFMIRDRRMQALVAKAQEPITPLIDKVRQLYTEHGISTILVMGGSGDYFDVADTVIAMHNYQPQEVTAQARAIAQQYPTARTPEGGDQFGPLVSRVLPAVPRHSGRDIVKWKTHGLDTITLDRETIDVSAVEQFVDPAQLRAIAATLVHLQQTMLKGRLTLAEILDRVLEELATHGFDALTPYPLGDFASFRRAELAAALNRWRSLQRGLLQLQSNRSRS